METQEQEVEAFRDWWRSNGKVVVVGVVVGLGGIIGWNWWQAQQRLTNEQASAKYSEVVEASTLARHDAAVDGAKAIMEEHPDSGYAALAALVGARSAYTGGRPAQAIGQLRWAVENASTPQVQDLARLRLSRVLRAQGKLDDAQKELDAVQTKSFRSLSQEIRGDIAFDRKDRDAAIKAYRAALADESVDPVSRQRLDTKLGDLGQTVVSQ